VVGASVALLDVCLECIIMEFGSERAFFVQGLLTVSGAGKCADSQGVTFVSFVGR
jgi:hypothetical protein